VLRKGDAGDPADEAERGEDKEKALAFLRRMAYARSLTWRRGGSGWRQETTV